MELMVLLLKLGIQQNVMFCFLELDLDQFLELSSEPIKVLN